MPTGENSHHSLELLAPAGGAGAFYAALYAGADAIYCALGHDFNARRSADNFSEEEFQAAVKEAHLLGVRVYVPINIEIKTREIPRVLELVERAWILGADAFIVQDWGMHYELKRHFPFIETHISTQSNIHDRRGLLWCRAQGACRVTVSRELSLKELKLLAETGVDIECFGHGALCFCYSGLCMLSSLNGDRSANRGLCAQPCRLHYTLHDDRGHVYTTKKNDHLLCPKDYCTQGHVQDLMASRVHALKIEGRMKHPAYVYAVVRGYRMRLDACLEGRRLSKAEEDEISKLLTRSFNRGFTTSYLRGASDNDMMSYDRSNNRGQLVGTVVGSRDLGVYKRPRPDKPGRFRYKPTAEISVLLTEDVTKGDLLELREEGHSDFLTSYVQEDAHAHETILCQTARPMPAGTPVRMIRSKTYTDIADQAAHHVLQRKHKIRARVRLRLGKPFELELTSCMTDASVRIQGDVVEPARTRPLEEADVVAHIGRMGASPFDMVACHVLMDEGVGMSFSALHRYRNSCLEQLEARILKAFDPAMRQQQIEAAKQTYLSLQDLAHTPAAVFAAPAQRIQEAASDFEICALVPTPELAQVAVEAGATRLYASGDALILAAKEGKSWPVGYTPLVLLDEVCREGDHARIDPFIESGHVCAVGNMSELAYAHELGFSSEIRPCIPVFNTSTIACLKEQGARTVWFSPELSLAEICELTRKSPIPTGLLVLGRQRAMTTEHCVLQAAERCIHNCAACGFRKKRMWLTSETGARYALRVDLEGRTHIYASRPFDATAHMPELIKAGMHLFMVDSTLLTPDETTFYIRRVKQAIHAYTSHAPALSRLQGHTTSRLFDEIG